MYSRLSNFLPYMFLLYVCLISTNGDLRALYSYWIEEQIIWDSLSMCLITTKTSIHRMEYTKQINSTCINTQYRGNRRDCFKLSELRMHVYLCLKSSYSIRPGNPSKHTLIPSKTPLLRSCWRTKKGSNTPEREGQKDSTISNIHHSIHHYLYCCTLVVKESLNSMWNTCVHRCSLTSSALVLLERILQIWFT